MTALTNKEKLRSAMKEMNSVHIQGRTRLTAGLRNARPRIYPASLVKGYRTFYGTNSFSGLGTIGFSPSETGNSAASHIN